MIAAWISQCRVDISVLAQRQQVAATATPADPAGTASASYVMMGIAVSLTPPAGATRAMVMLDGLIANSNNGGTSNAQLRYGTGTPPVNGAPAAGTAVGGVISYVATSGGGSYVPFSQSTMISGLIPGTTYWIGLALSAPAAGTASVRSLDMTVFSLLDPVRL
jgi:hypothetical protein